MTEDHSAERAPANKKENAGRYAIMHKLTESTHLILVFVTQTVSLRALKAIPSIAN